MEKNCVFCDIIKKGGLASAILFENEDAVIFRDINPKAREHYLVVPRNHIASLKDVDEEEEGLMGKLVMTAKKFAEERSFGGYKLVFNVGREGGQIIDHMHLHLLSGFDSDKPHIFV